MEIVKFNGQEYTLTQEAYYNCHPDKPMYLAEAMDREGYSYLIKWAITHPQAENEDEMCDWENATDVIEL